MWVLRGKEGSTLCALVDNILLIRVLVLILIFLPSRVTYTALRIMHVGFERRGK